MIVRADATPTYTITEIGLTGAPYVAVGPNRNEKESEISSLNASGVAVGWNLRYFNNNSGYGQDAFYRNNGVTTQVGLTGSGYEEQQAGGIGRYSQVLGLNVAGLAVGMSRRFDFNDGASTIGQDLWVTTGAATTRIGLSGTPYEFLPTFSGSSVRRSSDFSAINQAGAIAGISRRYSVLNPIAINPTNIGQDAWMYQGGVTTTIGLFGVGYERANGADIARFSTVQALNDAGQAIGVSRRYQPTGPDQGEDAWLYDSTGVHVIGFTGTGYSYVNGPGAYRVSSAQKLNAAGFAIGVSNRFSSTGAALGLDSWVYHAGTTRMVGLIGSDYEVITAQGISRTSGVDFLNASGESAGLSGRREAGLDVWIDDGQATHRVGLVGPGYERLDSNGTYRHSTLGFFNDAGRAAGTSERYSATSTDLGLDTWIADAAGNTQRIGLTGAPYERPIGGNAYRMNKPLALNVGGQVIGTSAIYNAAQQSIGTAGWFYDPTTGVSQPLAFSFDSHGASETTPMVLTDQGAVFGSYYNVQQDQQDLFVWTPADGMHDLGALVAGGMTANNWTSFQLFTAAAGVGADGYPALIAGFGLKTGQTDGSAAFVMSIVPEPSSLAALGSCAIFALRRRRA